jgi:hypothetical protein
MQENINIKFDGAGKIKLLKHRPMWEYRRGG